MNTPMLRPGRLVDLPSALKGCAAAIVLVILATSCAPAASTGPTQTVRPTTVNTAPTSTATTFSGGVSGAVYWNHHPEVGATVQISEMRPPLSPGGRVVLASGTTTSSGTFAIAYSGSLPSIGAFVPAHGPYLEGSRPASLAAGGAFVTDPIDLVRAITGLSVHDRDTYKPGPLTITWDPVPEATAYCITVYSPSTTNKTPASRCSAVAHLPGDLVTSTTYTTPALAADKYTIALIAITDVAIGELAPTGIAFRVVP